MRYFRENKHVHFDLRHLLNMWALLLVQTICICCMPPLHASVVAPSVRSQLQRHSEVLSHKPFLGNPSETGISWKLQRSIIKFHTWDRGESWVEAETGRASAVPIYRWSVHSLNNTGGVADESLLRNWQGNTVCSHLGTNGSLCSEEQLKEK
jgi:hypothetical protein